MNKLKYCLLTLIFVLLFPFRVSAQAVPSISSETFTVINGGLDSLNSSSLSSYGVLPFDTSGVSDTIAHFLGLDMNLQPSDYVIRPLSVLEQEDLSSGFTTHFYDSEGNEISINDLYYVNGINKYYSVSFYMDSSGNVLYDDPFQSNTLLSVGINDVEFLPLTGQNPWSWSDVYSNLASQIANNAYNYYPTSEDFIDNTYYVRFGYYDGSARPLRTGYVFVPNQFVPGLIVPENTQGHIQSWYTNDPSIITLVFDSGDPLSNQLEVSSGSYSVNGVTYNYFVKLRSDFGGGRTDVSFADFLTGNFTPTNIRLCTFEDSSYIYGDQISHSPGVYRKTHMLENPSINPNEMYDYDELQLTNPELQPELDVDFDPSAAISPSNYPVIYPNPFGVINPGINPLPGVNPGVNPVPVTDDDPIINIDNNPIGSSVPIINNLFKRFPFSIPWDVARIINGFVLSPQPPSWDFDYSITVWSHTYTTHFSGDLSVFNSLAELFRTLELIAFLIFLCFISYKYFF